MSWFISLSWIVQENAPGIGLLDTGIMELLLRRLVKQGFDAISLNFLGLGICSTTNKKHHFLLKKRKSRASKIFCFVEMETFSDIVLPLSLSF